MKTIGAFDAKTHLAELLTEVEAGNEVTITRRGVPVARLVPVQDQAKQGAVQAAEELKKLRADLLAKGVRVSTQEICDMVKEGRR